MKELRNYYRIKGTPEEIYSSLTNPFAISLWTGSDAEMKEEPASRYLKGILKASTCPLKKTAGSYRNGSLETRRRNQL